MAIEIVMPKLGWTMEEGVLDEWIKNDGEQVRAGDIIFVVESDKALQEIEAFDSGILRIPPDAPPVGSTVKIGELLAYLVQPGEAPPFELQTADEAPATATPAEPPATPASESQTVPTQARRPSRDSGPAASPRAKRVAAELNIDWTSLRGSGKGGRIVERDIRAAAATAQADDEKDLRITPLARRVALDAGLDLDELATRFAGARITRADVEKLAAERQAVPEDKRSAMTSVRRVTRDRMVESARTTAPVTLSSEVDATELLQLRRKLKADGADIVPTYTDLLAKLVAKALREHPALNASIADDEIVLRGAINIAVAVDTERGLLAPVLRNADLLSLLELATASAELVDLARGGALKPEHLGDATFTISNLGMYDIDAFTPVISLPQAAVLGIGRIRPRQVVINVEAERTAIRHMMTLSLTFDHRLVDGAPAARFLQRVKQYVETPYLWLVN
ncbi:MAG: dihydrolipoamide acetyltransferase family protein [Chloroflexi bacterium]|nr:dihydrolipoamide acetyltransferase family protein [Chloroflexota bacterium]